MAQKTINARFKNKRDTAENWTKNNPVLLDGEFGVESNSSGDKLKVGDGTSHWNDLPYSCDVNGLVIPRPQYKIIAYKYTDIGSIGTVYTLTKTHITPTNPVIAAGDYVQFRTDKASYTAYVSAVNNGENTVTATIRFAGLLPEKFIVDTALSATSENPVQNKVITESLKNKVDSVVHADSYDSSITNSSVDGEPAIVLTVGSGEFDLFENTLSGSAMYVMKDGILTATPAMMTLISSDEADGNINILAGAGSYGISCNYGDQASETTFSVKAGYGVTIESPYENGDRITLKIASDGVTINDNRVATVDDLPESLSQLTADSTHRLVTDTEKSTWNAKQDAITSSNKLPATNVSGLATIATSGKLSDATTDTTHRVVTDAEKSAWNGLQQQITTNANNISSNTVAISDLVPRVTSLENKTWTLGGSVRGKGNTVNLPTVDYKELLIVTRTTGIEANDFVLSGVIPKDQINTQINYSMGCYYNSSNYQAVFVWVTTTSVLLQNLAINGNSNAANNTTLYVYYR